MNSIPAAINSLTSRFQPMISICCADELCVHESSFSRRIKEEFENGRDYYKLHGSAIRLPDAAQLAPAGETLSWHNEVRFLG